MEEVSLRPLSLRPGGGGSKNPFAGFGKGAGASLAKKVALWALISRMFADMLQHVCLYCTPRQGKHVRCACLVSEA